LIRKRGKYYHFEIWLGGERKAYGSFNGKDGLPLAKDKREARDFEGQIRRQVIDGTWRQGEDRDSLKDFATFVDKGEAGILNLTFHDLRHTWSTRAAECGVPESVRRDILGHSSPTMTSDYTHTSPEAMEKAMELVADYSREKIFSLTAKSRQAG
jgi:integrase